MYAQKNFDSEKVAATFIRFAKDGVLAIGSNDCFYGFIRGNQSLFPRLDTTHYESMKIIDEMCKEVWEANRLAIQEAYSQQ
jgi:hypothetical protein